MQEKEGKDRMEPSAHGEVLLREVMVRDEKRGRANARPP
jgi:hypothetical protein